MNSHNWKEILAAAGVVFSLVFVGIEISQNTSATRGQTRTELAALNQEWLFHIAEPEVSGTFSRLWVSDDRENMDAGEITRAELLMISNLRRLENVYYQYAEGLVDESALDSYGFRNITPFFRGRAFNNWWYSLDNRNLFHPQFVELFEARAELSEGET